MTERRAYARAWGRLIKERRKTLLKMDQAEFARRIGVTQPAVAFWETGRNAPSPRMQQVLIDVLGIDGETLRELVRGKAA